MNVESTIRQKLLDASASRLQRDVDGIAATMADQGASPDDIREAIEAFIEANYSAIERTVLEAATAFRSEFGEVEPGDKLALVM